MTNNDKLLSFIPIRTLSLYSKTKTLYNQAFPPEERLSLLYLYFKALGKKADFFAVFDEDAYIGFVYLVHYKDMVFLFFFAVDEGCRGQNYGSKILEQLQFYYKDKRIALFIENTEGDYNNIEMRLRRKDFYLRNGFKASGYNVVENHVKYELLYYGDYINEEDMHALLRYYAGSMLYYMYYQHRGTEKG